MFKKVLNGVAQVSIGIGKVGVAVGKAGIEKVEEAVERSKENIEIGKETKKIIAEADRLYQNSACRFDVAIEDAKEAMLMLQNKQQHVIHRHRSRFQRLLKYEAIFSEVDVQEKISSQKTRNIKVDGLRERPSEFNGSNATLQGAAAGVATATAAVSATAMFATAGTGAAISGLHGAAAINATLAALGGGSLATGGFGIAGGLAVLGGLIVIPGIAVGGFFWDSNVRKAHVDAIKYSQEAMGKSKELLRSTAKFKNLVQVTMEAVHETTSLDGVLDGILNLFEIHIIAGEEDESKEISRTALGVTERLLNIALVTESGEVNLDASRELRELRNDMDRVKQRIGGYIAGLNERRRVQSEKQIEEARKIAQENKDNLVVVKPLRNEELRKVFIDTFECAKQEICIMAPWMNNYVMNQDMFKRIESALRKGIKIRIVYGFGEPGSDKQGNKHANERCVRTETIAQHMQKIFATYNERFKMQKSNTHGKMLICDDLYYVIGSFNFLSFSGEYTGDDNREEIGNYSEDKSMILVYKEKYFSF